MKSLGLTRSFNLRRESSSPTRPIRCRTELMHSYLRFEPSSSALVGSQSMNLTYYSKFGNDQLPSISIDGAELHWDNSKQKEVVSFILESNRARGEDDVSLTETLVVIEMSCFHPSAPDSNSSESKFLRKIHLLALLNRDIISRKNIIKPKVELNPQPASGSDIPIKERQKPLPVTITAINFNQSEPVEVDSFQIKQVTQNYANKTILNEFDTTFFPPRIDNRIDLSGETVKNSIANHRHISGPATNGSLPARFTPGLVNLKDLDSISMRLKSNSFLILTVSCSFVILTYTLCLLIYLKTRKNHNRKLGAKSSRTGNDQQQFATVISHPYNLQMPSDTQNRLENLLNARGKTSSGTSGGPHYYQEQHTLPNHYTELDDQHKLVGVKSCCETMSSRPFQRCSFRTDYKTCQCERSCYFREPYIQTQNQPNFAYYGTLTVMRAIRKAACLARYRMRNSRYQPNLKVIPESDYEQTQTLGRGNLEHCEQLLNGPNGSPLSMRDDQIEALLYNAMMSKCSHIVERAHKRKRECNIQQTGATLFARPIDSADSNETPEIETGPISRSQIIRNLKCEGNVGSEVEADVDTRI